MRTLGLARRAGARGALALAVGMAALATAEDARAFCRSSTCRSTSSKSCETDANGCVTDGAKLWWPTSCIGFAMNRQGTQDLDPDETRAVIRKAFQAWSDVPCDGGKSASMTFTPLDDIKCKKSQYNKTGANVNVVLFQDDDWKYRGIDATLAKTSVTYNDETGEIYDADIEVNTANNSMTITDDPKKVEYDLLAILTHEVGHFIGIAHSPDPGAVMYASYAPGSTSQRTLAADDKKAVCSIYPPGNGVACNTVPRNGFSGTCDDPPPESSGPCSVAAAPRAPSTAWLAVPGLALFALARRRRALGHAAPRRGASSLWRSR